jgi:PelA/Pel-15E family pectate lyase
MRPIDALRLGLMVLALSLSQTPAPAAVPDWKSLAARPDAWHRSPEGLATVANVLSHQSSRGSWPKNLDTTAKRFEGDKGTLAGTFDNGATVGEVRFLSRAFRVTGDPNCREAVIRAVDHILAAQYPSGGWPQSSPPGNAYHRHITFNDNTMANLLILLREVSNSADFSFVDADRRARAGRAFDRGVACIVASQIKVDGKLTVWCAQHDEVTLEPRKGRTYEPVSLSGSESAGLLILLMSLDDPGPDVARAVHAGARWFESAKLTGIRQTLVGGDKKIVADPAAPPLWARFYEIGTNRPIFSGRDGVIKFSLDQIEPERRNGYAWYGGWGVPLSRRYGAWRAKHPEKG